MQGTENITHPADPAQTIRHPAANKHVEDIGVVASQVTETFKEYARERPDVVALWCFGIGFVLGWKMKPW